MGVESEGNTTRNDGLTFEYYKFDSSEMLSSPMLSIRAVMNANAKSQNDLSTH